MPDNTPEADINDEKIAALREAYEANLKRIEEDSNAEQEALRDRGDEMSKDAEKKFKFDMTVRWKTKTLKLHLPQVAMRNKDMSLDLPQATMKPQEWIFHTPSVRMKRVKTGQYPEFHGFTVRWKDIFIDVPEPFMQEQRVILDVPEFKMARTSFVMGVPEFTWAETQLKLDIPEFVVHDINIVIPIETEDTKAKAEALKQDAQQFAEKTKAEYADATKNFQHELGGAITETIANRFAIARDSLVAKREEVVLEFEKHLKTIRAIKGTPAAMENAELLNQMQQSETDLLANQAKALADIDSALVDLQKQKEEAITQAINSEALTPIQ